MLCTAVLFDGFPQPSSSFEPNTFQSIFPYQNENAFQSGSATPTLPEGGDCPSTGRIVVLNVFICWKIDGTTIIPLHEYCSEEREQLFDDLETHQRNNGLTICYHLSE